MVSGVPSKDPSSGLRPEQLPQQVTHPGLNSAEQETSNDRNVVPQRVAGSAEGHPGQPCGPRPAHGAGSQTPETVSRVSAPCAQSSGPQPVVPAPLWCGLLLHPPGGVTTARPRGVAPRDPAVLQWGLLGQQVGELGAGAEAASLEHGCPKPKCRSRAGTEGSLRGPGRHEPLQIPGALMCSLPSSS